MLHQIKKGLDLPITGDPDKTVIESKVVGSVALLGTDSIGLKPTMQVAVGDSVKIGQVIFTDKKTPGVKYTSPANGEVVAINRGAQRMLQSVVINITGEEAESFASYSDDQIPDLPLEQVKENLIDSGLWTALRTRPYSKVPSPKTQPNSIFVNAMDSNPLAVDPAVVIRGREGDFSIGLKVVSKLTEGNTYLCHGAGMSFIENDLADINVHEFHGPHPAGLTGTHMHFLDPVSANKTNWFLNYQDVLAIGALFTTGKLNVERIISLAGPVVERPRFIKTRLGASTDNLTLAELKNGQNRIISGSVLSGRKAEGPFAFLGRYHLQVSALREGRERVFLGWQSPGFDKFSVKSTFISALLKGKLFPFTTSTEGSKRTMVPIGMYEKVMPLDIESTFLLRALIVGDTDMAQALGCLELEEEDLSLCTFVCPGKTEYGPILRDNLTRIELEG